MTKWQRVVSVVAAVMIASFLTVGILFRQECRAASEMGRMQRNLAKEVFRFHVLANSDSEEDQRLKLKVKDAVVTYMQEEIPEADSVKMTKAWAREHLGDIEGIARKVIRENGYHYDVHAKVAKCDFPDKTYGDITFPAGTYDALEILIGEAKGQNWWCVLYPNLCFIDSIHAIVPEEGKEKLREVLTEDEYDMVTAYTEFKIGWFFFGK